MSWFDPAGTWVAPTFAGIKRGWRAAVVLIIAKPKLLTIVRRGK
jgi:hypothetical protein